MNFLGESWFIIPAISSMDPSYHKAFGYPAQLLCPQDQFTCQKLGSFILPITPARDDDTIPDLLHNVASVFQQWNDP